MRLQWTRAHSPSWLVARTPQPFEDVYVWKAVGGWWVTSNTPGEKWPSVRAALRGAQQKFNDVLALYAERRLRKFLEDTEP